MSRIFSEKSRFCSNYYCFVNTIIVPLTFIMNELDSSTKKLLLGLKWIYFIHFIHVKTKISDQMLSM